MRSHHEDGTRAFPSLSAIAFAAFCFLAGLPACGTAIQKSVLGPSQPAAITVSQKAWLAPVELTDPNVTDRERLEHSLTLHIRQFMQGSGYFEDVSLLPGTIGDDDLVLHFTVSRLEHKRSVHPAYFPGSFLTLTLYIWLGGPITMETSALDGSLRIDTATGTTLAEAFSSIARRHNYSIWSDRSDERTLRVDRTELIRTLCDEAVSQLADGRG